MLRHTCLCIQCVIVSFIVTRTAQAANASREDIDAAAISEERNREVTTGSGEAEARALASANVITLDWEEIARRHYTSLAQILAEVPGLYVIDDFVSPSVGVRGVTGGLNAGT